MKKKALIGITGYHVRGEEGVGGTFRGLAGQGFSVIGHDYIHSVQKTGGIPLGIPVGESGTALEIIQSIDGLILSGGEDIDPSFYGEHPDPRCWTLTPERDRFELELLEAALSVKKPVLAICRGLQLVNVYFGGKLYLDNVDFPDQVLTHQFSRDPRWYLAHKVKLLHPILKDLYQAEEIQTNSYHHQSIKDLGIGLEISAVAEDGIIEGVFHPGHPNLLAVQWHPETMSVKYEEGLIPFNWLIDLILAQEGESR